MYRVPYRVVCVTLNIGIAGSSRMKSHESSMPMTTATTTTDDDVRGRVHPEELLLEAYDLLVRPSIAFLDASRDFV